MNKLLELKGQFIHAPNKSIPGIATLPKAANFKPLTIDHMEHLKEQLESLLSFWKDDTLISGALITVYYREIVAKSNRLKRLLNEGSSNETYAIKGVKFNESFDKHVFTYYISLETLEKSIIELEATINLAKRCFIGKITADAVEERQRGQLNLHPPLSKSSFYQILKDAYYVESFGLERDVEGEKSSSIVSIFGTDTNTKELLRKLGIDFIEDKMLDENTVRLNPSEIEIIRAKAPYLIAMKTNDLSKYTMPSIIERDKLDFKIPAPGSEPIIGVIDTLFEKNVYFGDWVEYKEMVSENIPKSKNDYFHGTAVSSIIVDGPSLNPKLNDGCGRFRVKHFGVATGSAFSSFSIIKAIKLAVEANKHIKVWNLSLGSQFEISKNFISPEAAILDKIQSDNDVVFIVSGTNKPEHINGEMRIGSPADSINSIVVNSVNSKNKPASYHRVGPVLSFFYKPDISYYGGDEGEEISIYSNMGLVGAYGTSFAAPWIARKMAYLIHVLGFSRVVAKALLIDSAAGWDRQDTDKCDIGYGVPAIHIRDIVSSKNDEIKMIFSGATEQYETRAFNIPIPLDNKEEYPYITRATLCYYPDCSRSQGVDYTDAEIDFQFGRVQENRRGTVSLKSFDGNRQGSNNDQTRETNARTYFRKWDNIKHLAPFERTSTRSKKSYGDKVKTCGLKMTVKGRLSSKHLTIPFGIVITLKEIKGVNRISDFINNAMLNGWLVNQVDIDSRIDILTKAEEKILLS